MHCDGYLFHYTDASALLSIVTKRELWATDLSFLNDRHEGTLLTKLLEQLLAYGDLAPGLHARLTPRFIEAIQQSLRTSRHNACVSFSRNCDSLTQFRMYCPPAGGFAIGFPRAILQGIGPVTNCSYNRAETYAWARAHLDGLLDHLEGESPEASAIDLGNSLAQRTDVLDQRTEATLRFKSPEFAQEEEERLCTHQWANCFRPSRDGNAVIPYNVVKLPNEPFEVRIVVGPSRDPDWALHTPGNLFRAAALAGTRWSFGHMGAQEFGFRAS